MPIDDVEGRIRQARQIAQLRDEGPVAPFSMDEIAEMRRELSADAERGKQASLPRLAALPADMLAAVHARLSGGNGQPPPGSDNSIGLTSLPLDEANDSQLTEAGKEKAIPIADDQKTECLERCSDLILMKPFSRRPGTFDECFAHCEGRAYFRHIQPYIPFPSK